MTNPTASNVVQFRPPPRRERVQSLPPPTTTKEQRKIRDQAWGDAECRVAYWRTLMEVVRATRMAQERDLPEARDRPKVGLNDDLVPLDKLREAISRQLLTPAPNVAALRWKQAAFARGQWFYANVTTKEQIERAIADDIAWLDAHKRLPRAVRS